MTLSKITVPALSLRKDIWTHFPVCLVRIPTTDSHDRWAIQWHQKHLADWSQNIPGYETITKLRLLKALMASPKWKVEKPSSPSDLCVIAMNYAEMDPEKLPALYAEKKEVTRIDDLRAYFPICWKKQENTYAFEFHKSLVKALARHTHSNDSTIQKNTMDGLLPILRTFGEVEIRNNQLFLTVPN
jgi:hypothetical protein